MRALALGTPDAPRLANRIAVAPLASPIRRGSIVLARHGEPALSRKVKLNADGYRRWWAVYEDGGILEGQTPPGELLDLARGADLIFASTRRRALETAEAVAGGKPFGRDPVFVEAPLPPPPLPGSIKFSPKTWGVISRGVWWFGCSAGGETRRQAQQRARLAAGKLVDGAQNGRHVLIVGHGFFNRMVGHELQKLGWRSVHDRGFRYWATRRFEVR